MNPLLDRLRSRAWREWQRRNWLPALTLAVLVAAVSLVYLALEDKLGSTANNQLDRVTAAIRDWFATTYEWPLFLPLVALLLYVIGACLIGLMVRERNRLLADQSQVRVERLSAEFSDRLRTALQILRDNIGPNNEHSPRNILTEMQADGQTERLLKWHWERLEGSIPQDVGDGVLISVEDARRVLASLSKVIVDYNFGLSEFLQFWVELPQRNRRFDRRVQQAVREHKRLVELLSRLRDDSLATLRPAFPPEEALTGLVLPESDWSG